MQSLSRASLAAYAAGVVLAAFACVAAAQTTPESLAWLRRIYEATQKLSYTGTFVYQQGERTETSRITHYVGAGGDIERLEILDGTPREIVRTQDTVRCYLPESRVVKVDRRSGARSFPAVLPEQLTTLARSYTISLGEIKRVAGYDCQSIVLTPVDDLRYGHELWADLKTGMLLKARMFDAKGRTVEQFTFTQLVIGNVSHELVRTRRRARDWKVEHAEASPTNVRASGWSVAADLPGFRKIVELKRMLRESRPVSQVVYSDGLAAVSVFIEPMQGRGEPVQAGLANLGAVHIFTREVADHVVTVVGEAPAASVQRIANMVEFRRPR
jgi:sigma-E factor negative regulatory protein RseB